MVSQRSHAVIGNLGRDLYGIESFVSDGEVRRIYIASDAKLIRKQAEQDCFPANRIREIKGIVDPANG